MLTFNAKVIDTSATLRLEFVQEAARENKLEHRVKEVATMIADNAPLTLAKMKYRALQAIKANFYRVDLYSCNEMPAACFGPGSYDADLWPFTKKQKPNFFSK